MNVNMETEKTLDELEKEHRNLGELIHKIRMSKIKEDEENMKMWYLANIEGNVYYGDKTTWGGYDRYMALIKPISVNEWHSMGTCKIESIEVYYNRDMSIKEVRHNFHQDMRYDMFATHFKKCTLELYENFMNKIINETKKIVKDFNVFENEK